jgi:ABC-type phosphate transport system substrate-binding protein
MRGIATWFAPLGLIVSLAGCAHYPPPLAPAHSQSTTQQDTDARECDRQVHSAGSTFVTGVFTAWSEEERDRYVACVQARGYTVSK